MTKPVNVKKKVLEIEFSADLGLRESEFKTVVANLKAKRADYKTNDEWASAITSMVHRIRSNPMSAKKVTASAVFETKCPMCNHEMSPITLMGSREALFCKRHNIVSPIPAN